MASDPPDLTETETSDRLGLKAGLASSSQTTDDGEHLDAALSEALGAEEGGDNGLQLPAGASANGFIPREMWCPGYLQAYAFAGTVTGLPTLKGVPDRDGGLEAAGAVYDSILDTPFLHFLIRPDSLWVQRAMVIGAFHLPILAGVRADIRARKAAKEKSRPSPSEPPVAAAA